MNEVNNMFARHYSHEDNLKNKNFSTVLSYNYISSSLFQESDYNEEISVRDLSREELKNEIINFSKFHDFVDALEISSALNLDVFEVNDVLTELIREGLFEEV